MKYIKPGINPAQSLAVLLGKSNTALVRELQRSKAAAFRCEHVKNGLRHLMIYKQRRHVYVHESVPVNHDHKLALRVAQCMQRDACPKRQHFCADKDGRQVRDGRVVGDQRFGLATSGDDDLGQHAALGQLSY